MTTQSAPAFIGDVIDVDSFGQYIEGVLSELETGSFEPAFREGNKHVDQGIQQNFIEGETAKGKPWEPRKRQQQILRVSDSESYEVNNPTLIRSSRLMQGASNSDSPDAYVDYTEGRTYVRGTDVEYAWFLNFGTKKMPAREFMDVPEEYQEQIDELIADHGVTFF